MTVSQLFFWLAALWCFSWEWPVNGYSGTFFFQLALACTPLTKSEEKERLLAVYITQRSCGAREKIGTSLQTKNSLLPTGNLPGRTRLNSARRVSLRISTQNCKCRVHYKWLFILWPYVVANWQITCALLLTVVLKGILWPLVFWRFFCGRATFG